MSILRKIKKFYRYSKAEAEAYSLLVKAIHLDRESAEHLCEIVQQIDREYYLKSRRFVEAAIDLREKQGLAIF